MKLILTNLKYFLLVSVLLFSCKKKEIAELPPLNSSETKDSSASDKQQNNQSKYQNKESDFAKAKKDRQKEQNEEKSNSKEKESSVSLTQLTATAMGTSTSQLSFKVSGFLSDVLVKNGDYVKKGQILAKLDTSIQQQQLKLAQYSFEQAKNNEYFSSLNFKRIQTLNNKQATTQIAYEQAEANWKTAQISLKQAEANLKISQINFNDTSLIAPFSGYIFNLNTWIGNYVTSNTPFLTISSPDNLQIQISVPQTMQNTFKVGDVYNLNSTTNKVTGQVVITNIVPYVDPNTKSYLVVGLPKNLNRSLMSGELILISLK